MLKTLLHFLTVLTDMVLLMNDQLNRLEAATGQLEAVASDLATVVANLKAGAADPAAADRLASLNSRIEQAVTNLTALKA